MCGGAFLSGGDGGGEGSEGSRPAGDSAGMSDGAGVELAAVKAMDPAAQEATDPAAARSPELDPNLSVVERLVIQEGMELDELRNRR